MKKSKILIAVSVLLLTSCGGGAVVTSTTTLAPTTTPNTTTNTTSTNITRNVTFYPLNGEDSYTLTVNYGESVAKPTNPLKASTETHDYVFDCWCTEESLESPYSFDRRVTDNLTLYAKYEERVRTVYVTVHDGDNTIGKQAVRTSKLSDFEYEVVRPGYEFVGFELDGEILDDDYVFLDDITVTAIYTDTYKKVSTVDELVEAIKLAKYDYTNSWDDETSSLVQTLNEKGIVTRIEILNDLDLGYYKLSSTAISSGIIDNFSSKQQSKIDNNTLGITMSDMFTENGMSQLKIEGISNLEIFSKNGAKITHGGIKLTSCHNVTIKNLEFDELWQWEDSASSSPSYVIGDYDVFGWAYFKISFCGNIQIDHCTFGKAYDGIIDIANPDYTTCVYNYESDGSIKIDKNGNKSKKLYTYTRAPYGGDGTENVAITNCKFNAGSDDHDGYLYKMMENIEADYQRSKTDSSYACKYLYYKTLRDTYNLSFEDILYGIAIPQKKGFLCGDREDDESFNTKLYVTFGNCYIKNIEDRLPKVRGGFAYLYNTVIDSLDYYTYRTKIIGAKAINNLNSKYKCALVSQGMLLSYNADLYAENVIVKGVLEILKNNESASQTAGFKLVNISYQQTPTSTPRVGGSDDGTFSSYSKLSSTSFDWHNKDNKKPINPELIPLDKLESTLNAECGTYN